MNKQKQDDYYVRINNLHKAYGRLHVLQGIDLDVKHKEKIIILGPSGGGKSTILRCLMGLDTIDQGEILVDNTPYITCDDKKRNKIEIKIRKDNKVHEINKKDLIPKIRSLLKT